MDREVNSGHNALERMLEDGSAEPMHLPFSLLKDITNCFSKDQEIGNGGFAVVYKGMVGHGMVAVKKLTNTFGLEETKFHKEVECLVKAKHKNVVRFLGYCAETQGQIADFDGKFVMADTRNWLLCFEYVPNGSLDKYIADASCGLEWDKRFEIIKGICQGLCYLHDKRILHLDLKPANILMTDHMIPKIADFGLSRCVSEEQTRIFTSRLFGSMGYLAPEFFRGQVAFASDIYSLGVIILEIITGEKGYPEDEIVVESWMNRLEGDRELEQVRVCTKIGIECMELDPKKRPAARHIINRLDSIVGTGINCSSVELDVSLLKEQQCQDRIGNTFASGIEDVAKRLQTLGNDQCQEKGDQRLVWGSQDTKQGQKEASIESHRNFTRNGGPIIQKSNSIKIFRMEELEEILSLRNIVGEDGRGKIYRDVLGSKLVTARKPVAGSLLPGLQFANEVIRRSEIIHENILRFIGCCLEMETPTLVYEFFASSLHDILHSKENSKVPLNLGVRLQIAVQVADGLAYMYSETNSKILLCGLEAANILLDDKFVPKITYFGISGLVGEQPGDYSIGRATPHNEDPAIMEDSQMNEQILHSFGIIILELISRKKATPDGNNSLVRKFRKCHEEGKKATELFDKEISVLRDLTILDSLAEIAVECLSSDVDARPDITQVAQRLLRLSRRYSAR